MSGFTRANVFTGSVLWTPQRKFRNGIEKTLLGGWTFSAMPFEEDGHPETIFMGQDVAVDGTSGRQHAELAPGVSLSRTYANKADMVHEYFNTAAIMAPSKVPWELMATPRAV